MEREFAPEDIVQVSSGILIPGKRQSGPLAIVRFMLQEEIEIRQLPAAMRVCGPYLSRQFPRLRRARPKLNQPAEYYDRWLRELETAFGQRMLPVKQIPVDERRDALARVELF